MEKHLKQVKAYDQHRELELNQPEKKTRMMNDELETFDHLHDNHRIRTLKEKNEESSHP